MEICLGIEKQALDTTVTKFGKKVMPPILLRNYNYSFNEIYMYHGYILYKVETIFPQSLHHYQNTSTATDGFTSPPKEVVLRIFITVKNPSTSVAIEPANFGSSGEHGNH
jgi:hypothetical protein